MSGYQPKGVYLIGTANPGGFVPIQVDSQGTVQVSPPKGTDINGFPGQAVLVSPNADDISNGSTALAAASFNLSFNPATGNWDRIESAPANADALVPSAIGNQLTIAQLFGFNGTSFDRIRVANVFKSVLATAAGNTIVWTPVAGKKFRLMGYTLSVAGTLAATGVELMKLTDAAGGTVIAQHQATLTITTPTGDTQIGADLGQGFLSGAINRVLNVNLSAAITGGGVAVNAWGTEE